MIVALEVLAGIILAGGSGCILAYAVSQEEEAEREVAQMRNEMAAERHNRALAVANGGTLRKSR